MEINCVTIKNFEVPGCIYYPGMELCLGAVLLEDWVKRGFVRPKKKRRKKRTVKTNTAITI